VYAAPNEKHELANTLTILTSDLQKIHPSNYVILLGDFNVDIYNNNHYTASLAPLIKDFVPKNGLRLQERNSSNDYTRFNSGYQVDYILSSINLVDQIDSKLNYHYHYQISDHVMITSKINNFSIACKLDHRVVWNTIPLLDGNIDNYQFVLSNLIENWKKWRGEIRKANIPYQDKIIMSWEGLLLTIRQAAYHSLGTRVIKIYKSNASSINPNAKDSKSIWKYARRKQNTLKPYSEKIFTDEEWDEYAQATFNNNNNRMERNESCRMIDNEIMQINHIIDQSKFSVPKNIPNLVSKFKNICDNLNIASSAGPDAIPAIMLKCGGQGLHEMFSIMYSDCREACYFPPTMLSSNILYIAKPGKSLYMKKSYRPITTASTPGKVMERMTLDFINPVDGLQENWFQSLQFAGRKNHGAEQLAFLLQTIISILPSENPIYVIFLDISSAYDLTWREALFAKIYKKTEPKHVREIATLKAVFNSIQSRVANNLPFFTREGGIPQGSTNSTCLFTTFLDDIEKILAHHGLGVTVLGILVYILLFLDDLVIILNKKQQVNQALALLHQYSLQYKLQFSVEKCKVLVYNAPHHKNDVWLLGPNRIESVSIQKYLTNYFSSEKTSTVQMQKKLEKAKKAYSLVHPLMGGGTTISTSSTIVIALIWKVLDTGRSVASLSPCEKKISKDISNFQLKIARDILGVTKTSTRLGTIAELGWLPESHREDLNFLLFAARLLKNPTLLVFMNKLHEHQSSLPSTSSKFFFHKLDNLLHKYNITFTALTKNNYKLTVKKACRNHWKNEWQKTIKSSKSLPIAFDLPSPYTMQFYCTIQPFIGRTLITKLRLNNLPLNGAEYNTGECEVCKTGKQETRYHFVLECSEYEFIRSNYPQIQRIIDNSMPNSVDKLSKILLRDNPYNKDEKFIKMVGKYISEIWLNRIRKLGITFPSYYYFSY
jgi:hypothetical protein